MASLTFAFFPSESSNDHQARVIVDGRDIIECIDKEMLGIDPVEFFGQSSLRSSGELLVGRCSCGCVGCCDARVDTFWTDKHVTWRSQYPWMKEIVFDRSSFESSIEIASKDTSWENLERRVERMISRLDFDAFTRRGIIFDWASARFDKETIRLSFHQGREQEMFSVPWDHTNEALALSAVKGFIESHA